MAETTSLSHFFHYCLQNHLPCAIYRLPGDKSIKVVAQKQSITAEPVDAKSLVVKKGFLFVPFNQDKSFSTTFIAADIFTTTDKLPPLNFVAKKNNTLTRGHKKNKLKQATRQQYISYVKHLQGCIGKGNFKKVVAARVVKRKKPESFSAVDFYKALCKKYPAAFVSLVYTPQYGLWIGATPEILLTVSRSGFKTYSLAGTKANTAKNVNTQWGKKEQQEQKIVSTYIQSAFKKVTNTKPQIKGPETVSAGNLLHLRTTFTYSGISNNKWPKVVAQLHPTPAVAGLPKKKAIELIQKNEIATRGFYSGYLGPVNLDSQVNLFVNLRCMQVLKNKLAVHVGCGITAASIPTDEWKESKMKAQTLLGVLKPTVASS